MAGRKNKSGKGHNNGGDRMQVDGGNGAQKVKPKCNNCGKEGHIEARCNQKKPCEYCQKPGHTTESCWNNPKSSTYKGTKPTNINVNDPTGTNVTFNGAAQGKQHEQKGPQVYYQGFVPQNIPTYNGSTPYCASCNSTTHSGSACHYSQVHLSTSKFICTNCGVRGHTEADCRHPDPAHCKICHKVGHKADTCQSNFAKAFYKAGTTINKKDERFIWNNAGDFTICDPYGAQTEQHRLEETIRQAQAIEAETGMSDGPDPEQIAEWQQELADNSVLRWKYQRDPLHHIPLLHPNAVPATHGAKAYRVTKPQLSSRSSTATTAGSFYDSRKAAWLKNLTQGAPPNHYHSSWSHLSNQSSNMNFINSTNNTISQEDVLAAINHIRESRLSTQQRQIRAHTEKSYRSYHMQNYNLRIRQLGTSIAERNILSDRKLRDVQLAMAVGVNFWRDPRAMEALVTRKQATCLTCGHEGVIHDGRMRAIPVENAAAEGGKNVLEIEDFVDWGLFVVFQCQCCNHGYDWQPRPSLMMDVDAPPSVPSSANFTYSSSSSRRASGSS